MKISIPTFENNSNNDTGLKELNNKKARNFQLNKNNKLSNDNINIQIKSLKLNKINLIINMNLTKNTIIYDDK